MRTIRQIAQENKEQYPRTARVLEEDFYMDDLLSGTDDLEEAITLQQQATTLLAEAQFNLRKWRSNEAKVLKHLEENRMSY